MGYLSNIPLFNASLNACNGITANILASPEICKLSSANATLCNSWHNIYLSRALDRSLLTWAKICQMVSQMLHLDQNSQFSPTGVGPSERDK